MKSLTVLSRRVVVVALSICAPGAYAQVQPDAGRVLQETRPDFRLPDAPASTLPPIKAPAVPGKALSVPGAETRVHVNGFRFVGNRVLAADDLLPAVAPYVGKSLAFGELIEAVDAVEARYSAAGYFLARGYLPPQQIKDGTIEIVISEGILGATRIEGESRVAPEVVYGYLDQLPKEGVLSLPVLERQVLLVNDLAGGQARLDLQAGDKEGTTDVVLVQRADDALIGKLEFNNHGATSTGEKRLSLSLNALSPFKLGERINFTALSSENSLLDSYNLRGEIPVGARGWRLTAGLSRAQYSLGEPFRVLGASGTADAARLGLAYPVLRSRESNLRFQVDLDRSRLVDRFEFSGTRLDKTSRGVLASLGGDHVDQWLGGGITRAEVGLKLGRLDLGSTARAQDVLDTAGSYRKISFNLQRQQKLSQQFGLTMQLATQSASKNLDSSEKFTLGGPQTLPGYANGEVSGDSGLLAKLALRWQATPELAVSLFANHGELRLAKQPLAATPTANRKRLADLGLGLDWQPVKSVTASLLAGWATGESPNPADNDKPRLWATMGYQW